MVLVGFKKFKGKNGNTYNQLYCNRPASDFDKRYSLVCVGEMLETVWVNDEILDKLTSKDLGKKIELITSYVNGRNEVVDIKIC